MKVLGTPKPSLQWFKDDLEVETYLIIIWRLKTNLCSQVFSSDRLEIKDEEDGGSVIVREARLVNFIKTSFRTIYCLVID